MKGQGPRPAALWNLPVFNLAACSSTCPRSNLTSAKLCSADSCCGVTAAIRLPSGNRLTRTFSKTDSVSALEDFCISEVRCCHSRSRNTLLTGSEPGCQLRGLAVYAILVLFNHSASRSFACIRNVFILGKQSHSRCSVTAAMA